MAHGGTSGSAFCLLCSDSPNLPAVQLELGQHIKVGVNGCSQRLGSLAEVASDVSIVAAWWGKSTAGGRAVGNVGGGAVVIGPFMSFGWVSGPRWWARAG